MIGILQALYYAYQGFYWMLLVIGEIGNRKAGVRIPLLECLKKRSGFDGLAVNKTAVRSSNYPYSHRYTSFRSLSVKLLSYMPLEEEPATGTHVHFKESQATNI